VKGGKYTVPCRFSPASKKPGFGLKSHCQGGKSLSPQREKGQEANNGGAKNQPAFESVNMDTRICIRGLVTSLFCLRARGGYGKRAMEPNREGAVDNGVK